jgi:hypothetical protein
MMAHAATRHLTWDYYRRTSSECTGGIQCDIPVILLVLAILGALILIFLGAYVIYRHVKYRRAFDSGRVPAQMLISGYLRDSTETGKEEPEKFVFKVHKESSSGGKHRDNSHDDCPVCLKSSKSIKRWIPERMHLLQIQILLKTREYLLIWRVIMMIFLGGCGGFATRC